MMMRSTIDIVEFRVLLATALWFAGCYDMVSPVGATDTDMVKELSTGEPPVTQTDGAHSTDEICHGDCLSTSCGDGALDQGESCDDGNTDDGDGCSADCRFTAEVINGDFETGTLDGWISVGDGPSYAFQAVDYTQIPHKLIHDSVFEPAFEGGTYGAYARTGDGIEVGFEQTIRVPPNQPLQYALDYAVREEQIPGQERVAQTVLLYLDGLAVASYASGSLVNAECGAFTGFYVSVSDTLVLRMVALRELGRGTGYGQVVFDNVRIQPLSD